MREVYLEYNPYKVETKILVDGEKPKRNSRLNTENRRLQEWVEEMPEILKEEYRDKNFKITFHGTMPDYEDVEAVAADAKQNDIYITVEHIPAKEVADKEEAIDHIFQEIQQGPFEELKKPDIVRAFNMAKSSDFEVSVVATMSAGKSTLINALLGQKLMPAKQEACTATITELKDNDQDHFSAKVYNKEGKLIQSIPELTLDAMNGLNGNKEVSRIHAEGNIPFVPAGDVSLVLIDTPGPNNSRDPSHRAATQKMLSESSKALVLYIMNATQLAVNDDCALLNTVAESMKVGGKQSRDRFIFVVNKLDDFKKGEDSIDAALEKVRNYLKDHGIENPNIYPASALTALNIRTLLVNSEDADPDDVDEAELKVRKFNRNKEMHFENYAPLTPSVRGQIQQELAEATENGDANGEALIHCGIVSVESAIRMYVQKYAKTAKIKNIVDTFQKRLESAKSFETTKQEIAENKDRRDEIKEQIAKINQKLTSGADAKKFKERVNAINFDREITNKSAEIIAKAHKKLEDVTFNPKMTVSEAELWCEDFEKRAKEADAEVQVKLGNLIENQVKKSAETMLIEYQNRLADLTEEINIGKVSIQPFELMAGEVDLSNAAVMVSNLTKSEEVKVGEEWVENTNKKWYKPWTWFQERGHYRDIIETQNYVDGEALSQKLLLPVQKNMFANQQSAVQYAKEQTNTIKREFSKKFDELDRVLQQKLNDLKDCANDEKNVERRIRESQARLDWLENVQKEINAILEI